MYGRNKTENVDLLEMVLIRQNEPLVFWTSVRLKFKKFNKMHTISHFRRKGCLRGHDYVAMLAFNM